MIFFPSFSAFVIWALTFVLLIEATLEKTTNKTFLTQTDSESLRELTEILSKDRDRVSHKNIFEGIKDKNKSIFWLYYVS